MTPEITTYEVFFYIFIICFSIWIPLFSWYFMTEFDDPPTFKEVVRIFLYAFYHATYPFLYLFVIVFALLISIVLFESM